MEMIKLLNNQTLLVAEVAQAHDGSLGLAHSFIDSSAKAGADAIKFQLHMAEFESTSREKWRVKFSKQDKSRYDYWKRMEFSKDEWEELAKHAKDCGLKFIISPFCLEALQVIDDNLIDAWKIASGEIDNKPLFENLINKKKPLLISTGMSSYEEIDKTYNLVKKEGCDFALLQCTSKYPCSEKDVGLNIIDEFKLKYDCPVGLSDHSGEIFPSLFAISKGVSVIELHVTFSKEMFGPDTSSSITFDDLKLISKGIRYMEEIKKNPVDKNILSSELQPMKKLFGKSIVAKRNLSSGHVIKIDDLAYKKPGDGISPHNYGYLVGKTLKSGIKKDQQFNGDNVK